MSIKYAILGLLHYKEMHGYKIKKRIEANFGHMWSVNFGQIYPSLKQLLEENMVTMKEVRIDGEKGPDRKLYSITETGKDEFARWLAASPEREMLMRDPFIMRFVFFGFGDRERSIELIEDRIALYEAQLSERRENYEKWRNHDIYVRLVSELGIRLNELFLEWLKEARAEILEDQGQVEGGAVRAAIMS